MKNTDWYMSKAELIGMIMFFTPIAVIALAVFAVLLYALFLVLGLKLSIFLAVLFLIMFIGLFLVDKTWERR